MPFKESSFSAVAISFGLRNTVDYEKVLKEMIKVEAKKVVKFKVGKPLADKVAGQKGAKKATKKK